MRNNPENPCAGLVPAVRDRDERLRAILETAGEGIIKSFHPAAKKISGCQSAKIISFGCKSPAQKNGGNNQGIRIRHSRSGLAGGALSLEQNPATALAQAATPPENNILWPQK